MNIKNILLILCFVGYIIYLFYDFNSVLWQNKILRCGFLAGSIFVTASVGGMLVYALYADILLDSTFSGLLVVKISAFLLMLILLLHTLFFAIPFDNTYIDQVSSLKKNIACSTGVYALCRHPGVIWMCGMLITIWWIDPVKGNLVYYIAMLLPDILYVFFQDVWTFPKTFYNYEDYKMSVPFLIPSIKSIRKCISDIRKIR